MKMSNPYRAAGTFAGDAYIERESDEVLRKIIEANDRFPYFLAARQSGKSSVIENARRKLSQPDLKFAIIDLSTFSRQEKESYLSFIRHFVAVVFNELGLPMKTLEREVLEEDSFFFLRAIKELLTQIEGRMIVCIDEIDTLLEVEYKDDFLSQIRALFNERVKNSEFARIQFVLAGATVVTALISDKNRSPFNVGEQIILDNLDQERLEQLVSKASGIPVKVAFAVATHLKYWTSGSVYLSQRILEKAYESGLIGLSESAAVELIDATVKRLVDDSAHDVHFTNIHELLRADKVLLKSWHLWLEGTPPEQTYIEHLMLTGIASRKEPFQNRIYREVFGIGGALPLTSSATNRNSAAFIYSKLLISLKKIRPQSFYRILRYLFWIMVSLSFIFIIYLAAIKAVSAPKYSYILPYFIISTGILVFSFLLLYIQKTWRHRINLYRQIREDLYKLLIECTFKAFVELNRKEGGHEHTIESLIQEILDTTAYALKLNPIDNIIEIFWPGKRSYGSVSVWYLEPSMKQCGTLKVVNYSSPKVPYEVKKAFDYIKKNYHPVMLDENWYEQTIHDCTTDGVFRRDWFRRLENRNKHVSIGGYVYTRGNTIASVSVTDSILFDPLMFKGVIDTVSDICLPWLEFRTYAAYPVFSPVDEGNTPRGVLIAFKTSSQPFMAEDRVILASTSRLLGILLSRAAQIEKEMKMKGWR